MATVQAALEALQSRQDQVAIEIAKSEKQLYDMETMYLGAEYSKNGTVTKGFEGFLSSKDAARKRMQGYKTEDRLFSLSSTTSQARKELQHAQMEVVDGGYATHRSGNFLSKGVAQKARRAIP